MIDALGALHRALQTYLVIVALLGLSTLVWSVTNVFVLDNATLASIWFGVAGAGTLLVAVLVFRHAYAGGRAPDGETGTRTP